MNKNLVCSFVVVGLLAGSARAEDDNLADNPQGDVLFPFDEELSEAQLSIIEERSRELFESEVLQESDKDPFSEPLGLSGYYSRSCNTIYTAYNDGFFVAYLHGSGIGSTKVSMEVAAPGSVVNWFTVSRIIDANGATIPVRSGYFYRARRTQGGGNCSARFVNLY